MARPATSRARRRWLSEKTTETGGGRVVSTGVVAELGAEDPLRGAVDVRVRHVAAPEGPGQMLGALLGEGLFDVQAGPERLGGVAQSPEEVGDGDALEPPALRAAHLRGVARSPRPIRR